MGKGAQNEWWLCRSHVLETTAVERGKRWRKKEQTRHYCNMQKLTVNNTEIITKATRNGRVLIEANTNHAVEKIIGGAQRNSDGTFEEKS